MPAAPSGSDTVRARRSDGLLLIALDNPSGFPRLTRAVLGKLHRLFDADRETPAVRAVVITGTEKCFAAGAELAQIAALSAIEALRFSALGQSLMSKIEQHAKPVVAAIRGYCLGGGLDLALACHLRVAASDAVFGHPGAGLGIMTGWGGTTRLPRTMRARGRALAVEMLTTGRGITAEEAYACGLVNRVAPPQEVLETAFTLARRTDRPT